MICIDRIGIPNVVAALTEISRDVYDAGQEDEFEALVEAIGLLTGASWWRSLASAPRDGTWILVAFLSPRDPTEPAWVKAARWVVPSTVTLNREKRELLQKNGGYWSASTAEKPIRSAARAWMPIPTWTAKDALATHQPRRKGCSPMYKGASRNLQHRHGVNRPHPSRGSTGIVDEGDLIVSAGNMSFRECTEERRRLGVERAQAENRLSAARTSGDKAAVAQLGSMIQSLCARASAVKARLHELNVSNNADAFRQAVQEIVAPDIMREIYTRATSIQEYMERQ